MSSTDWSRTIHYYDSIASEYDAQMDSAPFSAWARSAVRELVKPALSSPSRVLDFGCGTGAETAWLAALGHHLSAYDNSSGMMRELKAKCCRFVELGRVIPCEGPLPVLLELLQRSPPLDLVIVNFAVLDLIRDLRPVFAGLAPHARAGGTYVLERAQSHVLEGFPIP